MSTGNSCLSILAVLLLAMLWAVTATAAAGEGKTEDRTRRQQVENHFKPRLGTSHYLFELNGIDIGTGWVSMERSGDFYKISYEAKTNERADRFYKARYSGVGIMEIDPLEPVRARLSQRVRSKTRETSIFFEEGGRIIATETKEEEGEEPEKEVRETRADGYVLDPLSMVFLMQCIAWESGKKTVFDVYTGKARYEVTFTCVDRTALELGGESRDVWVIAQASRKLDGEEEKDPEKQSPKLMIYVSADSDRDVLKVETTRRIGHLTLTLVGFETAPGGVQPDGRAVP